MKFQLLMSILLCSLFLSCGNHKEIFDPKPMSLNHSKTTTCQLIEKEFVNKGGKVSEYKELYLRCSVQDYFIKICEGNVTRKELEPYINSGITVEMEIRNGVLDFCNKNPAYTQSRTGTYVIIKSIEK